MGLVNKVVPDDQLDAEVDAWCREIMERSPTAIAIAKRSFNADTDSIAGIGALGKQELKLYYESDESKEGVRAFNGKRKPEFHKYVRSTPSSHKFLTELKKSAPWSLSDRTAQRTLAELLHDCSNRPTFFAAF